MTTEERVQAVADYGLTDRQARFVVLVMQHSHNRARLYHVHHKPLYHAIGDPESRYRRAVPARRAAERLMRLDAALLCPELDWLTTRPEKLAHLEAIIGQPSAQPGAIAAAKTRTDLVERFPGTFPIGVDFARPLDVGVPRDRAVDRGLADIPAGACGSALGQPRLDLAFGVPSDVAARRVRLQAGGP